MLRTLKYFLTYIPIRLLDIFILLLPPAVALHFGESLGIFISFFFPRRRKLMMENLSIAFPEKTNEQKEKIIRSVWRNIGRVAVEFIRMSSIHAENFRSTFEIHGEDRVRDILSKGKGIILVGFHYGNWEYSGLAGSLLIPITAVARPIKNPFVERWVKAKRGMVGMDIILHRDAVRGCLKALKKGRSVGILVDQNLYTGGVFVDFFGRPAATTPLPELLHSRTDSPVMLLYCERAGEKLKLIFEEVEKPTTQAISWRIEQIIRRHPEQWFWVHNRWKRQPQPSEVP